jgi:soluble lytic murein transglycosylase
VGLALIRLATSDVESATSQMEDKWGPQLHPEERDWVWAVIGRQAAQRLMPEANAYFSKVERDRYLSDDLLGWKVRAALRAPKGMDWRNVLEAVNAMSDEASADSTWVYWKARALLASPQPTDARRAEAQKLLESIASPKGFYEQLALEELGQKITVPAKPAPITDEEKKAAPGTRLNRALYAISWACAGEGNREWNSHHQPAPCGRLQRPRVPGGGEFACDREVWDRCINTSERNSGPNSTSSSASHALPRIGGAPQPRSASTRPMSTGLIRQESCFVMDARSSVGASGLMQVMPATARWTARKIGMDGFTADKLGDRETNIAIGTGYLKLVLDDFAGSMPLAAAAYNAGPSRPRAWRNGAPMEGAAWAENVPFNETRDYVKKVLANTTFYAAMLTGQPQSLKARLGMIGTRATITAQPGAQRGPCP